MANSTLGMEQELNAYDYFYGAKSENSREKISQIRGFLEEIEDPSDSFWGIFIFDRALYSWEIEKCELIYIGKANKKY